MTHTNSDSSLQAQPKVKVFGKKAGLTVEAVTGRTDQRATVNLELAPQVRKGYDWTEKSVWQLSDTELPLMCAVMLRLAPEVRIVREGKWLSIARQPNQWYLTSNDNGRELQLKIAPGDGFLLGALLMQRLQIETNLDGAALMGLLRCFKPDALKS